MKKQLINEAFRLQQLAGIQPINSLNKESHDEPKSKLDRIVQQAWQEDDINKAKNLVANYISNSKINNDSKKTILNKMKVITDKEKLDYYLANSLLKFEKMGLKEGTQIKLNGKPVDQSSLEIDGADSSDYPDFSDAYFSAGNYEDGTPLTDDELDQLGNDYPEVVNEMAFESFID
jgi:hypothetical protein